MAMTGAAIGTTISCSAARANLQLSQAEPLAQEAFHTLTAAEAETLKAVVARLIPADESGPGALEAGAATYIDRALGSALASSRDAYRKGLAMIDAYARSSKADAFHKLSAADQDEVLKDVERGVPNSFSMDSGWFFGLVRDHTIQGAFSDPYYGGNAEFIGWDLIGYPGLRMVVTREEQRMAVKIKPIRISAYDMAPFGHSEGASHSHSGVRNGD
jgi:gluconate 2-dehydrogenase gamma chain